MLSFIILCPFKLLFVSRVPFYTIQNFHNGVQNDIGKTWFLFFLIQMSISFSFKQELFILVHNKNKNNPYEKYIPQLRQPWAFFLLITLINQMDIQGHIQEFQSILDWGKGKLKLMRVESLYLQREGFSHIFFILIYFFS